MIGRWGRNGASFSLRAAMASVCVFVLLLALMLPISADSRKELRSRNTSSIRSGHPSHSAKIDPSRVVQLSWKPRVFVYKGLLSEEECHHLMSLAYDKKDIIMGSDNVSNHTSQRRQLLSSEVRLNNEDDVVGRIEERLFAWTFLPKENSGAMQILHFQKEDTKMKYDFYDKNVSRESLVATVVMYLSDDAAGGEILFPQSEPKQESWSHCGSKDNPLRPTKGNAVLFFSSLPSASPDERSLHARCPVVEGGTWAATKSFYTRRISSGVKESVSEGSECNDEDDKCAKWAALGECKKNPVFMIGSADYYGTCRNSCNVC